MNNDTTIYKVP